MHADLSHLTDFTYSERSLALQNVRQHALSVLTDLFLDKNGSSVPTRHLSSVLSDVCVPLAGRRILKLQMGEGRFHSSDELMIEFELCIGLIFKPLRHHLQSFLVGENGVGVLSIWKSVLSVLEEMLCEDKSVNRNLDSSSSSEHEQRMKVKIPKDLKDTMNNLANEHLRNAIKVLIASGVLLSDESVRPSTASSSSLAELTTMTIGAVGRMGIQERSLREWKQQTVSTVSSSHET